MLGNKEDWGRGGWTIQIVQRICHIYKVFLSNSKKFAIFILVVCLLFISLTKRSSKIIDFSGVTAQC